jgi:hypothetical protein
MTATNGGYWQIIGKTKVANNGRTALPLIQMGIQGIC